MGKKLIYRCGWCGHPLDEKGKCLTGDLDKYIKDHEHCKVEQLTGECCENAQREAEEEVYISESRMMDGEGVHW